MIPILYENDEVLFTSNGIGRLRDCISCIVTEERNGIYECDFEYPVNGANYELIQIGRIVGVTHEDTSDVQPFDIVSFSKPIEGVVTFHCTHISYRQSYMTVTGSNINSLSAAFTLFGTAQPSNPFNYQTDKTSTGFLACADGIPRTVRQMLGGIEGSILDAYGGEYEWDTWNVILHSARGQMRDFSIRYGVNMLTYTDEVDSSGAFSSCIPYWTNGETTVVASKTDSGNTTPTGRGECVPLDLSDKFEDAPTTTQLKNAATSYMSSNQSSLPAQTINVSFVRLQYMDEYADYQNLLRCGLCDTINVIFPDYDTQGQFKIVKTVWNVLNGRYDEMELGSLSITLSEALGITDSLDKSANTFNNLAVLNDLSVGGDFTAGGNITTNSDIYVRGHDSPIGDRQGRDNATTKTSGTSWTDVQTNNVYVDLSLGVYIIHAMCEYQANATGRRGLRIVGAVSGVINRSENGTTAVSGVATRVHCMCIATVNTAQKFTLQTYQNSGSTLDVHYYIESVRIR